MSMSHKGLTKLIEEMGEAIQEAAKLQAFPDGEHPDGKGSLLLRLQNELADVRAASMFVIEKYSLDYAAIASRTILKFDLYNKWDVEPPTEKLKDVSWVAANGL